MVVELGRGLSGCFLEPNLEPSFEPSFELSLEPNLEPFLESFLESSLEPLLEPHLEPFLGLCLEPFSSFVVNSGAEGRPSDSNLQLDLARGGGVSRRVVRL